MVGAIAEQKCALQGSNRAIDSACGCKRSEVTSGFSACATVFQHLRIVVSLSNQNIGKRFVVAQQNIIPRLKLFNQVGF